MFTFIKRILAISLLACSMPLLVSAQVKVSQKKYKLPILKGKADNPVLTVKIEVEEETVLEEVEVSLSGTGGVESVNNMKIFTSRNLIGINDKKDKKPKQFAETGDIKENTTLMGSLPLERGSTYLQLVLTLNEGANPSAFINVNVIGVKLNTGKVKIVADSYASRLGIALRQHKQDNVHTYRIPGLATANDGSLLAIYDVRYNSSRDLQGHMDIGLSRSLDKGKTWLPMQIVMDMGTWGNLPEKFNGVSDANILVDKNTGNIFIAALWMHGVINDRGEWVEGLNENSDNWNHQWRNKGSQPGLGVKETAQFLLIKSTDNGKTWSEPVNLTEMCKRKEWWLWAPAPGQGITMKDGTLVIPTQGRNETGKSFSNITYSKDGGKTWKTSNEAVMESTTECMVVELSNGNLMLNMRSNENTKDTSKNNGRAIAVTKNLGKTWSIHPTSHRALQEPVCMASIIRHDFIQDGHKKSVLLFSNPDSKTIRRNLTVKISYDDGKTWSKEKKILLDEGRSRGYSCLTSIDNDTIGILYESSQADLVFQTININELL